MREHNSEITDVQPKEKTIPAHVIIARSQEIAGVLQTYRFLKAAAVGVREQTGTQVHMQLMDPQRTMLFVNSKLIEQALVEQFQKTCEELALAGIDITEMMEQEDKNFASLYNQESK